MNPPTIGTTTETHYGPEIRLDADVYAFFPDAKSVNRALRGLIALAPRQQKLTLKKQVGEKKAKYIVRKKTTKSPAARK